MKDGKRTERDPRDQGSTIQVVPHTPWDEAEDLELRREARELAEDPINQAIIARLQEDGRESFTKIARDLDLAETTVRNRVNRMVESRLMRIMAVVDPVSIGITTVAMIGLKLAPGADVRAVAKSFTEHSSVTYVIFVTHPFDLLVEVFCDDQVQLRTFLLDNCYGRPEIASVSAMVGLELFKSVFKLGGI